MSSWTVHTLIPFRSVQAVESALSKELLLSSLQILSRLDPDLQASFQPLRSVLCRIGEHCSDKQIAEAYALIR